MSAFAALAADDERLSRFLALTGLRPDTIRQAAAGPGFLAAVLDHVASEEALLVWVAGALAVPPERIVAARQALSPAELG